MVKIVLTGGPGAGKTTLAQVLSKVYDKDVVIVPEAASLLFTGGFPRWKEEAALQSAQRAIYHVQIELENSFAAKYPDKILILDRGTVDGAAYWPKGSADFFRALGTNIEAEYTRYNTVLYLESAPKEDYLANMHKNPNRIESWDEASKINSGTFSLWKQHPHLHVIKNQRSFHHKIMEVLPLIEAEVNRTKP